MKRIIKLTESDLTKIIRKITESDEFKYGHEKINKLYDKIGDDEDVKLDDSGGDLSGKIVKKIEMLKIHDIYGLLDYLPKEITSLDDVLNDDLLGILSDDDTGLFDLKHVSKFNERESADFVDRRKKCKNFNDYEHLFVNVQKELKAGKRKLLDFKFGNLQVGSFYVHNGLIFYVEKINITQLDGTIKDTNKHRNLGYFVSIL
jgi:hypothetical protein